MEDERKYFLRLLSFYYGKSMDIISLFLDTCVLNHGEFGDFLNTYKHKLFHKWKAKIPCCECAATGSIAAPQKRSVLTTKYISAVYKLDGPATTGHELTSHKKGTTQHCLCKVSAISGITTYNLDIALVHCIIQTCFNSACQKVMGEIEAIRAVRNDLFHSETRGILSYNEFERMWMKLENAVLNIAAFTVSPSYKNLVQRNISNLKNCDVKLTEVIYRVKSVDSKMHQLLKELRNKTTSLNYITSTLFEMGRVVKYGFHKTLSSQHDIHEKLGELHDDVNEMKTFMKFFVENTIMKNPGKRQIEASCTLEGENIDENIVFANLCKHNENVIQDERTNFKIKSIAKKCIILELEFSSEIIGDAKTFYAVLQSFIKHLIQVGNIDTQKKSTLDITFAFKGLCEKDELPMMKSFFSTNVDTGINCLYGQIMKKEDNKEFHTPFMIDKECQIEVPCIICSLREDELMLENDMKNLVKAFTEILQEDLQQDLDDYQMSAPSLFRFCAAIDIGQLYSGFAFASLKTEIVNIESVIGHVWQESNLIGVKAPTCVLLDSSVNLVSFGYNAENRYCSLKEDNKHESYYFFENFSSVIGNRIFSKETVSDKTGKFIDTVTLLMLVIRYFKTKIIESVRTKVKDIEENQIYYIFPVHSFWKEDYTTVLENAIKKAGIYESQFLLTKEAYAAHIYWQLSCTNQDFESHGVQFDNTFMLVDAGGSMEITIGRISNDGRIETLYSNWHPLHQNDFLIFLEDLLGKQTLKALQESDMEDYIFLLRGLEYLKRCFTSTRPSKIVITIPVSLMDLLKEAGGIETVIENSPYSKTVSYQNLKLYISSEVFRELFMTINTAIFKGIDQVIESTMGMTYVHTVLFMGGLVQNDFIQASIKRHYEGKREVFFLDDPGIAVAKGAVCFGNRMKYRQV